METPLVFSPILLVFLWIQSTWASRDLGMPQMRMEDPPTLEEVPTDAVDYLEDVAFYGIYGL